MPGAETILPGLPGGRGGPLGHQCGHREQTGGGGAEAPALLPALPPLPSQGPFSGPHGRAILAVGEAQTLLTLGPVVTPQHLLPGTLGSGGFLLPWELQRLKKPTLSRSAGLPRGLMRWPGLALSAAPPHLMSPGPQPPVDPTALLSTSTCQAQAGPHPTRTVLTAGQPGGSPAIPWPHRAVSVTMTRSGLCSLLS